MHTAVNIGRSSFLTVIFNHPPLKPCLTLDVMDLSPFDFGGAFLLLPGIRFGKHMRGMETIMASNPKTMKPSHHAPIQRGSRTLI